MKKLIKQYLPFAVIIAFIYLVTPMFFHSDERFHPLAYQFAFPATALLSGLAYSWKRGVDFTFPLIAPIIYIGSVLIYSHFYHWAIYVFIYLIVGMLGCFIGDMVYKNNLREKQKKKNPHTDSYKITISNISVEKKEEDTEDEKKNS